MKIPSFAHRSSSASSPLAVQAPTSVRDHLFIGGDMVKPESGDVIEVISPVTEELIGTAPSSTPADVDAAVRAARAAFDDGPWPPMSQAAGRSRSDEMSIRRRVLVVGTTIMAATAGSAGAAQAGTYICVPPQAGVAVVSGGPNGTCDSVSTPVQLPSSAADQKTLIDALPYMSFQASGIGSKPTITFKGVNLSLVKGGGEPNVGDGTANLVIGAGGNPFGRARTGSSNLVVGPGHGWSSNGNLIAGQYNDAQGKGFGAVLGHQNKLTGGFSNSILGGEYNSVSGEWSTVAGGRQKTATGTAQLIAPASNVHWAKFDANGTLLASSEPLEGHYANSQYALVKFKGVDMSKCAITVQSADGKFADTTHSDWYGYIYARSILKSGSGATNVPYDIVANCDR
jgi:hypothetical protein